MSIHLTPIRWWMFIFLAVIITACGTRSESWPGISASDDNTAIFAAYKRTVVSLNPDQTRNWAYNGENDTSFYATPTFIDGIVYVGDFKGRIHAIDAESGERLWMYEPERTQFLFFELGRNDRIIGQVTIGEDTLFAGDEYGVFALDMSETPPNTLWEFETKHAVWSRPLYISQTSVENELCPNVRTDWDIDWNIDPTLFVVSLDQHIYALDPDSGDLRWSLDLDGGIAGNLTLDCLRQRIYVGTMNQQVLAIDIKQQKVIDRFETEGWVWGGPVIYETGDPDDPYRIYFSDLAGYVYEVSLTEDGFGERAFKRRLSNEPLRATPLIVETLDGESVLVVGSEDQRVYAINLTPSPSGVADNREDLRWVREIDGRALANLTWVDHQTEEGEIERLIITGTDSDNQMVVALRLEDGGRVEWAYKYEND
ncbi:MAG: hypothetical protein CUN55_03630 [Phototrophicales bacterium]|nr:MAG: hypothetical protein CUN55_03630 [Phototrophicales bacterium]